MKTLKTYLAYAGLYLISASDSIRYSMGWVAWGVLAVGLSVLALLLFLKSNPRQTLSRVPKLVWALFAWMLLSLLWSFYPIATAIGLLSVLLATVFAFYLINAFSWRELLKLIANTMRFIIVISLVFELYASFVVRGPISPIYKDFQNPNTSSAAYYWSRGQLFLGDRIQGIVGNANLLAYVAMLGIILFSIQYAIHQTKRAISVSSILLATVTLLLTRSAGVAMALSFVALALVVLVLAERKSQQQRHQFYRVAYTIAGIALFFVAIYNERFFTMIGKSPDLTGRSDLWQLVIGLIQQRPWFGWGWIGYWQPGVKPYDGLFVRSGVTYYQAHDIFLDFWVQIGLVGLVLLLAITISAFVKLWRLAVRHSHPLYSWPLFIFLSLLGHNILESRLIVEIGWVLFLIAVVKINEPEAELEPDLPIGKRDALLIFGQRLLGRGWHSEY